MTITKTCPRCGNRFEENTKSYRCGNCGRGSVTWDKYHDEYRCNVCHAGYGYSDPAGGRWICPKCGCDCQNVMNNNCYLTSACCGYMGMPDDCYELQMLREFRDSYMSSEEMKSDVQTYYQIAPKIVDAIDSSESPTDTYDYIYSVIKDCVKCIESGDYPGAYDRYKQMSLNLQNQFL